MIRPHDGPQTAFLSTRADIAIYGGAAGGGKTWALIAEAARHTGNAQYRATIFRRNSTQVTNQGGLWDEAARLYPLLGATPREHVLEWKFPSGAEVKFTHLQHEPTKYDHQGGQYAFIGWDELTHFTESQFWYLLGRNRTMCGVKPYMRATCNPDASSWVAALISWWIDQESGLAIPERAGVLRWFYRPNGAIEFFDSPQEAVEAHPQESVCPDTGITIPPQSLTFIPAKLSDNPTLCAANPQYRATLQSQVYFERARLLDGNWKIMPKAGEFFKREWFKFVKAAPKECRWVRAWDKAAGEKPTDDRSAGSKVGEHKGEFYIADVERGRWSPMARDERIADIAEADGSPGDCKLVIEQEPGGDGKTVKVILSKQLAKYAPQFRRPTVKKWIRLKPFSAQAEAGNVYIVGSPSDPWVKELLDECENFDPDEKGGFHDDMADATGGAINELLLAPQPSQSIPRSFVTHGRR